MTRIKIDFPNKIHFQHKTLIGVNLINYGGHLGNDAVLTLFQDARIAFLKANALSEINLGNNVGVIQSDAAVQYLSEGHLHDHITISLSLEITSKIGFDFYYKIEAEGKSKPIAIGKTGMIAFNYELKKLAAIPEKFKDLAE